jgi:hypothetical protein
LEAEPAKGLGKLTFSATLLSPIEIRSGRRQTLIKQPAVQAADRDTWRQSFDSLRIGESNRWQGRLAEVSDFCFAQVLLATPRSKFEGRLSQPSLPSGSAQGAEGRRCIESAFAKRLLGTA